MGLYFRSSRETQNKSATIFLMHCAKEVHNENMMKISCLSRLNILSPKILRGFRGNFIATAYINTRRTKLILIHNRSNKAQLFIYKNRNSSVFYNNCSYIILNRVQIFFRYVINVRRKHNFDPGRTVAQAVSRWLHTAETRVRVCAACGICGGQSSTGAGFLRVLQFPLPIIIPPISPSS
jgi:hypothetical protein